jgi:flavin-dependent dehydrogenase
MGVMPEGPRAHDYDVIIMGGGPAGSLAASLIRRQDPGRRLLILEREHFPRHHVGESLIPSWRPILERAGALPLLEEAGFMRKVGTLFQWGAAGDEQWTIDFRDPQTGGASPASYQVDRAKFDHLLLGHARSLGVEVHEGAEVRAVERLAGGGHRVRWKEDGDREATCAFIVDATGGARLLSRLWGIKQIAFDDMNNFAVYGYWKGSQVARFAGPPIHEHERWTWITSCPDGWVWHIPTFPDLVSVGVVTDARCLPPGGLAALEEFYLRNVREAMGVGELLAGAELVRHPKLDARVTTIRDWSYHAERVCGPDWFLCGDAAAFVDPILSSGILLASNGASLAANALHTLWNDAGVDVPLLLESYQSTYDDMARSYHRLAQIWYSRNFKYQSWHWEAKRQQLRAGRHPAEVSDAHAFLRITLGSFTNPVEGAFADRGLLVDLDRPDSRIYLAHLFKGDADHAGVRGDEPSEAVARARVRAEKEARWRDLLGRRVRLAGATHRRRESYFSDATMSGWQRVQYVETRPEGATDPFERVVFPSTAELPAGVMPFLDGSRTLREVVREVCAAHPVGTQPYSWLAEAVQQQVLQLDMHDWLAVEGAGDAPAAGADFPPGLVEAVGAAAPGAELRIDPLGTSLQILVRLPGSGYGMMLVPASIAERRLVWREVGGTALSHRGAPAALAPLARAVLGVLGAWEAREPGVSARWWRESAPALAGELRLTPRAEPPAAR